MGKLEAFFGRFGELNMVPWKKRWEREKGSTDWPTRWAPGITNTNMKNTSTKILGRGRCGLQEMGSAGVEVGEGGGIRESH